MTKTPRLPSLIVLAIAIAIVVWAYTEREVHATVTVEPDDIIIKPAAS